MKDFFISYNSNVDGEWAEWIAWVLEAEGYTVVLQAWDILPGDNFLSEMQEAMTGTSKTIALLSEQYFQSRYAREEWTAALKRNALVPIKVKECEPEGLVSTRVFIDLIGSSEKDAVAKILGAFSGSVRQESAKAGAPGRKRNKPDSAPPFPGEFPVHSRESLTPAVAQRVINETQTDRSPLSTVLQVELSDNLKTLPISQLNLLIHRLAPPLGAIRPMPTATKDRVADLLRWAGGKRGPGLRNLQSLFGMMVSLREGIPAAPPDADQGVDVIKTCDRRKQEELFNSCFKRSYERRKGYAQFFIIHGRDQEGHESLVERFCCTTLLKQLGGVKLTPWDPGWPQAGKLKADEERLISFLFEQAGSNDPPGTLEARTVAFRDVAASLSPVVAVMHTIRAADFNWSTTRLIKRYARFWDELKRGDGNGTLPLFVVFLNVVYPLSQNSSGVDLSAWALLRQKVSILRVKIHLLLLAKMWGRSPLDPSVRQRSSFTLLQELPCVRIEDVRDWLRVHRYGQYEFQRMDLSNHIFEKNQWQFSQCKNMSDVERALHKFVGEHSSVKRAYL